MKLYGYLILLTLIACDKTTEALTTAETFVGEKYGCGDFRVYRENETGKNIVEVVSRLKHEKDTVYSVTLGQDKDVDVRLIRFAKSGALRSAFCNDVVTGIKGVDTLQAVSGHLMIHVYQFTPGMPFSNFKTDVEGHGVIFRENGVERKPEDFLIDSVATGWFPG